MKIKIGHLYPDLLNLYGDRGNIQCMKKRLEWRGIEAEVFEYNLGDRICFEDLDLVLLGGGSDREQQIVCRKLRDIQKNFKDYVEDGGTVIAVCGGYQLLGHYYDTSEGRIEGLSLVDLYTEQGSPRLISNIVIESSRYAHPVVGFENHGGRTYIGDNEPFGRVLFGHGNVGREQGQEGYEGVQYKNVTGTYLHGPLLPKNPDVCDDLLRRAMKRRWGVEALEPLDDTQELDANASMIRRLGVKV